MSAIFNINDINISTDDTESDVEQKFIYPFITSEQPHGLGISSNNVLTKRNINKLKIDKGSSSKIYYPDFILLSSALPIVVVEAKKPDDTDLIEAYREARLYANELNSKYQYKVNPVSFIAATNGIIFLAGHSDSDTPLINCVVSELQAGSIILEQIIELIGENNLSVVAKRIEQEFIPQYIQKPNRIVGGKSIQEEEIQKNPLGEAIANQYNWIFNPDKAEERKFIAQNGYITTKANQRNSYEMDKLVKLANSASDNIAIQIQNTKKPIEFQNIISKYSYRELILLIGKVGAGKSTFIDYLQYKEDILPKEVNEKIVWVRLDLNKAPLNKEEIYRWLQKSIIENIEFQFKHNFDFEDIETLEKIYSVEINTFRKGVGKLLVDTLEYNQELYKLIKNKQEDLEIKLKCYIRYFIKERGQFLILVLDNCDRQDRDSQLLMFDVASWAKEELKSIIILPLRDETFDNYKDTKPLDTAIKEFCFRIISPPFQKILARRVQLALDKLENTNLSANRTKIELPNDMYVTFSPKNDSSIYLSSMLSSVLENDNSIRQLLTGLSGGNIRKALEMFLNFCSSGHIPNEEIIKIRNSKENYTMPNHIAIRALMRGDSRFYQSKFSYIKNIIDADKNADGRLIYFTRLSILRWLKDKVNNDLSKSNRKGYFGVVELISELEPLGFNKDIIFNQIGYLASATCLITEDFKTDNISQDTLIKIAPAGYAHLNLLENDITYLFTIAEDTWLTNDKICTNIKNIIISKDYYLKLENVYRIAKEVVEYLNEYSQAMINRVSFYHDKNLLTSLITMEPSLSTLKKYYSTFDLGLDEGWENFCELHAKGKELNGYINNVVEYGIFVKLYIDGKPSHTGLIHKSNLPNDYRDKFQTSQEIKVVIDQISINRKGKIGLVLKD